MENFKCKDCGHEEFEIINVQTKIEKEMKAGAVIIAIVCGLIAMIGILILIINAIKMQMVDIKLFDDVYMQNPNAIFTNKELIEAINNNSINLAKYNRCKAYMFMGIGVTLIGFLGFAFTAVFHNADTSYKITNESRRICKNCGRKHKIKKAENGKQ